MKPKTAWLSVERAKEFALGKGFNEVVDETESFRDSNKRMGLAVTPWRDILRALYMKTFQSCDCWDEFQKEHWSPNSYVPGAWAKACQKYERVAKKVFSRHPTLKNILGSCR